MVAWRRLVDVYEPSMKPSVAGQLLGLLNWNLAGDVEARLALSERDDSRYEICQRP